MRSPEEQDVTRGSTTPDREVSLPVQTVHITVSRIATVDGSLETRIWLSRRVRRFYAMGLLTEALAMLTAANSECEWCSDTPGCIDEEEDEEDDQDDYDEDDNIDGQPAVKPKSPILR